MGLNRYMLQVEHLLVFIGECPHNGTIVTILNALLMVKFDEDVDNIIHAQSQYLP